MGPWGALQILQSDWYVTIVPGGTSRTTLATPDPILPSASLPKKGDKVKCLLHHTKTFAMDTNAAHDNFPNQKKPRTSQGASYISCSLIIPTGMADSITANLIGWTQCNLHPVYNPAYFSVALQSSSLLHTDNFDADKSRKTRWCNTTRTPRQCRGDLVSHVTPPGARVTTVAGGFVNSPT